MLALLLLLLQSGTLVSDVRSLIAQGNFPAAESRITEYRAKNGITPDLILARSWMGRGALAAKSLDEAEKYAQETYQLALNELKKRPLDAEPNLPLALGAAIEVRAHVMAGRGERAEGVRFLQEEVRKYRDTSIRARVQKNIHLLSLEGKPAPPLEGFRLQSLKGKPALLFFWAHWCGDCKAQAPVIADLLKTYGPRGSAVVGPTQLYGYTSRGQDATPAQEKPYIEEIRKQYYKGLETINVPVSEENFRVYGVSTTPTLVLLDKNGTVRLYHPGNLPRKDLADKIEALL